MMNISTLWDLSLHLFMAVMSVISANYLYSAFSTKIKGGKLFSIATVILFFLCSNLIDARPLRFLALVACIFLITLQYDFNIFQRLLFTFLLIATSSIVELITARILMLIFAVDLTTVQNGQLNYIGSLMSKFLEILLFFSIRSAKHFHVFKNASKDWLGIYLLPVSIFTVHLNVFFSMKYYHENKMLMNLSLVSLVLLIASNLLIIQLIDNINRAAHRENQLLISERLIKQQAEQYRLLFENNERVMKLRHDHKNFIIGILSEIQSANYDNVKTILERQLETLSNDSGNTLCGDSVIDTVIGYKSSYARSLGIDLVFEYRNIHNLRISAVDLSVLLGNAIDNAIEATEQLPTGADKTVNVYIYNNGKQIIIGVKNNVSESITVSPLKTTKENKLIHGYGILNMKQIAQKYSGTVSFKCENNVFNTAIILTNGAE